jgi:hypothetical protein
MEADDLRWHGTTLPALPTPALNALGVEERERIEQLSDALHLRWFHAKHDALGFHHHVTAAWHTTHPESAVFVTRDPVFTTKAKLDAFRTLNLQTQKLPPGGAVGYLMRVARQGSSANDSGA